MATPTPVGVAAVFSTKMFDSGGLLWSILLLTVIGVGALLIATAVWAFRKRLRCETRSDAFTIQDLREMRDSSAITDREYETMRAAILRQARDSTANAGNTGVSPDNAADKDDYSAPDGDNL